jgi:hypothetical protein
MKSEVAKKLKVILANKSQEQKNQEWAAIKALNLVGPSMFDVFSFFAAIQNQGVNYSLESESISASTDGVINYALAA